MQGSDHVVVGTVDVATTATATTLLYRQPGLPPQLLAGLTLARTKVNCPFTRGLTSLVYRLSVSNSGCVEGGENAEKQDGLQYCLKRVAEEDQMPPHSVRREMLFYRFIEEERSRRGQVDIHIPHLLAAFRDESDPFSVIEDLILPFYPATLEDLLNEPSLQVSFSSCKSEQTVRPAAVIAWNIVEHTSVKAFVRATSIALFSAIAFLHSSGIAHRDVKPSNLVVDRETLNVKLIDFGTCHLPSYVQGDDGRGGVTSEVGTGAFRAPECLFSPLEGYDSGKVDIWQAGATLAQFFLPLKHVQTVVNEEKDGWQEFEHHKYDEDETIDDRPDWEKALWADDAGAAWSKLASVWTSEANLEPTTFHASAKDFGSEEDEDIEETESGWKRETLFDATRGDLGLANSIFDLRGLPSDSIDWPESDLFQPSLQRMPFYRRSPAAGGLRQRLIQGIPSDLDVVVSVIDDCLQLSASRRQTAQEAVERLS